MVRYPASLAQDDYLAHAAGELPSEESIAAAQGKVKLAAQTQDWLFLATRMQAAFGKRSLHSRVWDVQALASEFSRKSVRTVVLERVCAERNLLKQRVGPMRPRIVLRCMIRIKRRLRKAGFSIPKECTSI